MACSDHELDLRKETAAAAALVLAGHPDLYAVAPVPLPAGESKRKVPRLAPGVALREEPKQKDVRRKDNKRKLGYVLRDSCSCRGIAVEASSMCYTCNPACCHPGALAMW